jgi:uncharacterized protein
VNEPETIRQILEETKTIAVVGLSDKPDRASLGVSRFMQRQGYRILPVNPLARTVLGEQAYRSLDDAYAAVEGKIDLVNVFRAPEFVPAIVKDVIRLKLKAIWLQESVVHAEAAEEAEQAGVKVVMDRCILKDRMAAGWRSL